jgi:cytosine/adenosine deaminase-related metal-dependent hydrolase
VSGRDPEHLARRLARYPTEWKAVSAAIRARAGGRCECDGRCGLHHDRRCVEENGQAARFARGRVVLTVAHLNHVPEDCRPENLRAMCQRCHLRYDVDLHVKVARENRTAKRNRGTPPLFEGS